MSSDFPLPADFHRPMVHAFENVGNSDGTCGFCGLTHPDYGDPANVLPDPPAPPADLGAPESHLAVRCDECGAGVGRHCQGPRGNYYAGHFARRIAAKRPKPAVTVEELELENGSTATETPPKAKRARRAPLTVAPEPELPDNEEPTPEEVEAEAATDQGDDTDGEGRCLGCGGPADHDAIACPAVPDE